MSLSASNSASSTTSVVDSYNTTTSNWSYVSQDAFDFVSNVTTNVNIGAGEDAAAALDAIGGITGGALTGAGNAFGAGADTMGDTIGGNKAGFSLTTVALVAAGAVAAFTLLKR